MPSTPSLTLTAQTANRRIRLVLASGGTPPTLRNDLYRSQAEEYDGVSIRLTDSLANNGTFYDYDIASGKSYVYFVRAIDSGGATADSASVQGSVVLGEFTLHAVTKLSGTSNKVTGTGLTLYATAQTREFLRQLASFDTGTQPLIVPSGIEELRHLAPITIKTLTDAERRLLQYVHSLKTLICLRDSFGNKMFGVVSELTERYQGMTVEISFQLQRTSYSEALPV